MFIHDGLLREKGEKHEGRTATVMGGAWKNID
jgi:hypothetical protein